MANPNQNQTQRELVVPPGNYVFTQDTTKGVIKVHSGPIVVNPTAQEVPVVYDGKQFRRVDSLEEAMVPSPVAPEGSYMVLKNPAEEKHEHPDTGAQRILDFELSIGSKVVIPGPATFPLWPGQSAEVIEGHHQKSNQYLLVRVYNDVEAKKNWETAVKFPAAPAGAGTEGAEGTGAPDQTQPQAVATKAAAEIDLTMGKVHVIKGTEVSFYIPPTGVEVLKDPSTNSYVRDALTLERMEYCILVDENGEKRYETGPQVVFPTPTEVFQVKDGAKKQSAIELNDLQGLHLKAIADCEFNGVKLVAGQEYFLTGAGLFNKNDERIGNGVTIYYPREEIAFVRYDGKTKIFAVTVPEGEGRYVLNRITGDIQTVKGPKQLLPNPIKFVIVRRVLTEKQVTLFYPGNQEALDYNRAIAGAAATAPTTRAGAISEGDLERFGTKSTRGTDVRTRSLIASSAMSYAGESSRVSGDQRVMGDEFERSSGYTQPRTLTLNTRYQGAVAISVWTGYAVEVVSKTGDRRVEEGPTSFLLDYDEELTAMEVSTGKPKNTDNLLRIGYLRVENNKVSDKVRVETADHVEVDLSLSYQINFTGDPSQWFSVENYVKFFCDHARSLLKGAVRKLGIEEFYSTSTEIIRTILLGEAEDGGERPGLYFDENGMQGDDVEVLGVTIVDEGIRAQISKAAVAQVTSNIDLSNSRRDLLVLREKEEIKQAELKAKTTTQQVQDQLAIAATESRLKAVLSDVEASLAQRQKAMELDKATEAKEDLVAQSRLAREKAEESQRLELAALGQKQLLEKLNAETESMVSKLKSLADGYGPILGALADKEVMVKVSEAMNLLKLVNSDASANELINNIVGLKNLKGLIENGVNGKVAQAAVSGTPQA